VGSERASECGRKALQVKWEEVDGICSAVSSGYTRRLGSLQGFETRRMILVQCAPHMRNGRLNILPSFLLSNYCSGEFDSCRHAEQEQRYHSVAHFICCLYEYNTGN